MYIPAAFREERIEILHGLMRQFSFSTLITVADGAPFATHLPLLLEADAGAHGTLRGHMARANPQWKEFEAAGEALAIFQGPHAYISSSWYEAQPSVPTWNYAVVHAYGRPSITDDAGLRDILAASMETFDSGVGDVKLADMPEEYVSKMMRGIVGFTMEITRIEGKLKLSQNRPPADLTEVIEQLRSQGAPDAAATAEAMVAALEKRKEK